MRCLPIVLLAAILAACQSTPPPRSVPIASRPAVEDKRKSVPDIVDVTFMARGMLPPAYDSYTSIEYAFPTTSSGNISPGSAEAIGLAGASAAGQNALSSSAGATAVYVGSAISAADALLGAGKAHGNLDTNGYVLLPKQSEDISFASGEQARQFIRTELMKRINAYAAAVGRTTVCIQACSGFYPTFLMRKTGEATSNYFDPAELYVTLYVPEASDFRAHYAPAWNNIVGFEISWVCPFFVSLNGAAPVRDHKTSLFGEAIPNPVGNELFRDPIERKLLRFLTDGKNYFLGAIPWREVAWNGRIFAIGDRSSPRSFILYEIDPESDRL